MCYIMPNTEHDIFLFFGYQTRTKPTIEAAVDAIATLVYKTKFIDVSKMFNITFFLDKFGPERCFLLVEMYLCVWVYHLYICRLRITEYVYMNRRQENNLNGLCQPTLAHQEIKEKE